MNKIKIKIGFYLFLQLNSSFHADALHSSPFHGVEVSALRPKLLFSFVTFSDQSMDDVSWWHVSACICFPSQSHRSITVITFIAPSDMPQNWYHTDWRRFRPRPIWHSVTWNEHHIWTLSFWNSCFALCYNVSSWSSQLKYESTFL